MVMTFYFIIKYTIFTFRRVYHVFEYFTFFFNAVYGFYVANRRLIYSMFSGALRIGRLDKLFLLKGFHNLDEGNAVSLQWRNNWHDGISNHQPHHCLLNRLFRRRSKKAAKHRVTGRCAGNSPVTGEFPAQKGSNAENVSIWWRNRVGLNWILTYREKKYRFLLSRDSSLCMKTDIVSYLYRNRKSYNDIIMFLVLMSYLILGGCDHRDIWLQL